MSSPRARCWALRMRQRSAGSRAPSPGNGGRSGWRSPGPRRAGLIPRQHRLAPRFLGLQAGAGPEQLKLRWLAGFKAKWGAARDSPVPRGPLRGLGLCSPAEELQSPTGGGHKAPPPPTDSWSLVATDTGRGWEGARSRAPAHATLLAPRSLPRRRSRPSPSPRRAPPSGERPGDSRPAAKGARGAAGAGAECRPPCALVAPALRSGTELGGAQRALFPRFRKGHPGGGAP
ncbi:hypothetical protein PAL_GLEAN10017369 [Pteropus alecto]|uniref:Uncharacterized protein n=1 Tax=Pteropus alecto TaxID=9402 RepID=L5K550_PTEAL|nr:hypothetical protein PAL_GLEAN10017369 [Pteropus alecto]